MNDVIKEPLWQISVIKSPLPPRLSPFPHRQTSASFILTDYSWLLKGTPEHFLNPSHGDYLAPRVHAKG